MIEPLSPRVTRGLVFALLMLANVAVQVAQAAASDVTVQTDSGPRHALVIAAGDDPRPTVLVLHGALGTGAYTARTSGFAEAAAIRGFTAVFPDGIDRQWNDGRSNGPASRLTGPDDVAFLRALVQRLVADRVAQPDRVYLAGISNGGMMSFTMACKAGALFAGIGTIIANLPAGIDPCGLKAVPLVMVNGTADPMVPYRGGAVGLRGARGTVHGVDETAAAFARVDGCGRDPVSRAIPKKDPSAKTAVVKVDWTGCRPGVSVTLYRVDGGGHGVPGRPGGVDLLGPVNLDIVAADVIMEVFAASR